MNKLLLASTLLLVASAAHAEGYRLVSSDNTELTALCIKSIEAPNTLLQNAQAVGLDTAAVGEVRCNGQTLPAFVSRFLDRESAPAAPVITFAFNKNDDSELTELCYAAVKSEQEYEQVKDAYFSDEQNIEEEVQCNGIPLKEFA
ncbi:MAG: hypothetical protein V4628_04530, partial [Pseudomonadota bacterium]